ncbi:MULTISPECIES: sensor histidine kinase KdpD [unclassified Prevotella]|uniref:sensor histidine kinase n=1 Tax=unclassified Prevotella TaxID=2638335 RepID=UPI00056817E9|nr:MULTISPECIES: sensor histidine kinase [unclassified Prevotella]SEW08818.1 Signal transduction histidine kinase [Prevotella sp. khp7]
MTIVLIILVLLIAALGTALYFQMKSAKDSAEEGQQLLKDYQKRVDELEHLLKDYRDLQQNFNNVGEGYEQALLAFDKMEEERQAMTNVKEKLEKQVNDLMASKSTLEQSIIKKKELIQQAAEAIKQKIDFATPNAAKIAQLANTILNLNDVETETTIQAEDNCQATDITDQAIRETGIDKIDYLRFINQAAEEAQATMLFTNQPMAVRVLVNLLDNAMKFTTSGSVTLLTNINGSNVEFVVEDTGTGITAEDAEKVFEPFTKLNSFFDGAGCGLTVARSIARRLNGDVKLDTEHAGGARFIFTLPI